MTESADYLFDAFISYTRDHPAGTWVSERLFRDFVGYLAEELGRKPKVFFDRLEIQPGDDWDAKIRWGLRTSKVLVAICSSRYFYDSDYCRMEWSSFGDCEVGGTRIHRPRVPVRYNDGHRFPAEARQLQQADFSEANFIIEAFYKNDARAVVYEENVRRLAVAVTKALEQVPPFSTASVVPEPSVITVQPLRQPRL
jgi:hypothetical protein